MKARLSFGISLVILIALSFVVWFGISFIPFLNAFKSISARLIILSFFIFIWGIWQARDVFSWKTNKFLKEQRNYIQFKRKAFQENFKAAQQVIFQKNLAYTETLLFLTQNINSEQMVLQNGFQKLDLEAESTPVCYWYFRNHQLMILPNMAVFYTEMQNYDTFLIAKNFFKLLKSYSKKLSQIHLWTDERIFQASKKNDWPDVYGFFLKNHSLPRNTPLFLIFNTLHQLEYYALLFQSLDQGEKILPLGFKIEEDFQKNLTILDSSFESLNANIAQHLKSSNALFINAFTKEKALIKNFIEKIWNRRLRLAGIYFTAQEKNQYLFSDYLIEPYQALTISPAKTPKKWKFKLAILIIGLAGVSYLYKNFQDETLQAKSISLALDQIQLNANNTPLQLSLLEPLVLEYSSQNFLDGFTPLKSKKKEMFEEFQNLESKLLKDNTDAILFKLQTPQNSDQLYHLLAGYLILTGVHPLEMSELEKSLHILKPNQKIENELHFLGLALKNKEVKKPAPNSQIIHSSRFVLQTAMLPEIILNKLKKQYIYPHGAALSQVNPFYTSQYFDSIYHEKIPDFVHSFLEENWVLGKIENLETKSASIVEGAQNDYLNQYLAYWKNLLAAGDFNQARDLKELANQLDQLAGKDQPFNQFLKDAQINLLPLKRLSQTQAAAQNLSTILNTLQSALSSPLVNQSLTQLARTIHEIASSPNSLQKGFDYASARIQNPSSEEAISELLDAAQKDPGPLQPWFYHIANQTWKILLQTAYEYINQTWQNSVYPLYSQSIENRFPINPISNQSIELSSFIQFFGPEGNISQFFNQFLAPFVDTSTLYWKLKIVDQESLPLSNDSLEMFMRAALIRKMFFAGESQNPQFSFNLTPEAISPAIKNFNFRYNQSKMSFQNLNQSQAFTWKPAQDDEAEIILMDFDNHQATLHKKGPWALLQLLYEAQIKNTDSPKLYQITYTLNGETIELELLTHALINPFIPNILTEFKPEKSL